MVCPVTPPHPAFVGGDEITEIPNSRQEKLITEGIKAPERQWNQGERDPRDKIETAGQTDQQYRGQTDRETQITSSCEEGEGGAPPHPRSRRRGGNARRR